MLALQTQFSALRIVAKLELDLMRSHVPVPAGRSFALDGWRARGTVIMTDCSALLRNAMYGAKTSKLIARFSHKFRYQEMTMNSNRATRDTLRLVFAILLLLTIPGIALAQNKEGHTQGRGSSAPPPPPPPHPSSPPPSNTNHGSGNTGGSASGGTGHPNSGGSSNPYGSYGNKGGAGSTTGGANGSSTGTNKSSNPYGSYGNSHNTNTATGGATGGSNGSHGNTTTGGANGGTYGNHGNSNTFGSNGNHGGTNSTAGGGNTNKGGSNSFGGTGNKGGNTNTSLNKGGTGATGGNRNGGTGNSFGSKGGVTNTSTGHGFNAPPGGHSVTRSNGARMDYNKSGKPTSITTKTGTAARFDSRGHVSTIRSGGMTINHGAHGGRTIVTERTDHTRLVSYGHGRGYGERGYMRGGHEYRGRTYYRNGRYYARAYRGYYWHGYRYYGYMPGYYYNPGFYGWAYNPWSAPIAYGWGWGGSPWYGAYGYYFSPYAVYPSASFWLTDYLLAQNLQANYEAQQDAGAQAAADYSNSQGGGQGGGDSGGGGQTQLTPEVKQAIADEVASQIAADKAQAANQGGGADPAPAALDPNHRTFVVATTLSVQNADGTGCSLSSGDVLRRIDDTADSNNNVSVRVVSSQRGDCSTGSQVPVGVDDLQDMHNHLHEQVDDGLAQLNKNQGHGGLPSGPAGNPQANPDGQAQPDTSVGSDLDQQQQQANQTEQDVQQSANSQN
jgi:hypothetical protein